MTLHYSFRPFVVVTVFSGQSESTRCAPAKNGPGGPGDGRRLGHRPFLTLVVALADAHPGAHRLQEGQQQQDAAAGPGGTGPAPGGAGVGHGEPGEADEEGRRARARRRPDTGRRGQPRAPVRAGAEGARYGAEEPSRVSLSACLRMGAPSLVLLKVLLRPN